MQVEYSRVGDQGIEDHRNLNYNCWRLRDTHDDVVKDLHNTVSTVIEPSTAYNGAMTIGISAAE